MPPDPKTTAQLLKLQRLVESLVVRELEAAEGPPSSGGGAGPRPDAASRRRPSQQQQQQQHTYHHRRVSSSNGSDAASLLDAALGLGPGPTRGAAAAQGHAVAARNGGGGAGGGLLEDGVGVQVAALQGQLAVLGEQLASAYRAADGAAASPRASLAAPTWRGLYGGGGGGGAGGGSPGRPTGQDNTFGFPSATVRTSTLAGGQYLSGPVGLAAGDAGGGGGGGEGLGAGRMRALAVEERAGREAAAREDERLRGWIQDLRADRRRLEDRLLEGDPGGGRVQGLRDELEKQVLTLSRQRDQLAAELSEYGVTRTVNAQLAGQVEALELALATESERVARYKEVRPALDARLSEVSGSLDSLRRQHAAALEALTRERDAAIVKARRSGRRANELDAALSDAAADVHRLEEEVRAHAAALEEVRASGEVLQSAGRQLQASMEAQARDAATRLAGLQSQLESSQADCIILRRQLEVTQQEAAGLREQSRDAHSRLEALRGERDRLAEGLTEEQRAVAAARQQAEALGGQLRSTEDARVESVRASSTQLEAVRRQHAADLTAMQKQYESQLAAGEKQYLLLQRQYDAGLAGSETLAQGAAALRRERDALWAEAENLKAEVEDVRKEKAEVSSKLTALRTEVRATMDDVARDRDDRLAAASGQSEALVRDMRAEAEQRLAATQHEYESRLAALAELAEQLRGEAVDSQRTADKYRSTVNHLKEQVRDLLLSRDAAERELATERTFNEELNRLLTAIKASAADQSDHVTAVRAVVEAGRLR